MGRDGQRLMPRSMAERPVERQFTPGLRGMLSLSGGRGQRGRCGVLSRAVAAWAEAIRKHRPWYAPADWGPLSRIWSWSAAAAEEERSSLGPWPPVSWVGAHGALSQSCQHRAGLLPKQLQRGLDGAGGSTRGRVHWQVEHKPLKA